MTAAGLSSFIAAGGHRAARRRLAALAEVEGVLSRRTELGVAVRSGLGSNDLNGVVAVGTAVPTRAELAELDRWWGPAPASWLAPVADADVTAALLAAGWRSERPGRWAGRRVDDVPDPAGDVRRVESPAGLARWLDVAEECGWFDADERSEHGRLVGRDGLTRWVSGSTVPGDRATGMVTAWRDGAGPVELVDVAVAPAHRRRDLGTRLVETVLGWAGPGALVVAAPSPDGWALMETLGFVNVAVVPDVCFYRAGR